MTGLIKGISFAVGTVHDFQMFKNQSFEMAKDITILADLGFLGIQKIHGNSIIPHKKSKYKPLTEQQKDENKKQASKRVMIEHINRDCKIFRICSSKYRGKHKNYDKNWRLITAIVNLKRTTRNLKMTEFN
ncbi:transposase family protein [Chryseobacterium sp. ERMR1:04]|uniref:transposase family protein n=1 Tax=Chryseobacterium sp. ERMR1:04 TaxID=1705393 RepID=UPI000A891F7C|nr:transposase family protein [Chryseobacterium sp. ERMR1:04]